MRKTNNLRWKHVYCLLILFYSYQSFSCTNFINRRLLRNYINGLIERQDNDIIELNLAIKAVYYVTTMRYHKHEAFSAARSFLKAYRQYEKNDTKIEILLHQFYSDPMRYALLLKKPAESIYSRTVHGFENKILLSVVEVQMLNFLRDLFSLSQLFVYQ